MTKKQEQKIKELEKENLLLLKKYVELEQKVEIIKK